MNKVLLIWELVPEETEVYNLELDDKELKTIKKCHASFINLINQSESAEKALHWLNEKLDTPEWKKCRIYGQEKEGCGKKGKEQFKAMNIEGSYTVIVSGFIL